MWNGTHTKAYILNSYESVMCLTIFACTGFHIGFPALFDLSLYLYLPLLATWLLLHHSPGEFHLTPLDSHVQVMKLEASQCTELVDSPSC